MSHKPVVSLAAVDNMAPLTERQQQAEALTQELQRLGVFVVSPLPLADDARLRFQVLAPACSPYWQSLRNGTGRQYSAITA